MKLPETFCFLRPGWWGLHLFAPMAVFAAGVGLGIFHASGHGGHDHGAQATPVTDNPLRDEMRDLQIAYDGLNAAVILGNASGVEEAFHAVHARREATVARLAAGTLRPPRNAHRLDEFVARDDAFHTLVEETVTAARAGDLAALRIRSTELQSACIACHAEYR